MASIGVSAIKLIDSDGDALDDGSGKLNVNATLVAGTSIDIGDVDIHLSGNVPLLGGAGAVAAGVLRTTLASDDPAVTHLSEIEGAVETIEGAISGSEMQVDVVASLPSGSNTIGVVDLGSTDNAVLDAMVVDLAAIEALLITIDLDTSFIKASQANLNNWSDGNYANVNINLAGSDAPTGGGAESGALRVTIANDSTGVITVDGTVDLGSTATGHLSEIEGAIETIEGAISGSEMQVDVVAALPAGTNAIGKLAANSGVDIGDVDITSIAAGDNNIGNVDIVSLPQPLNATNATASAFRTTGSSFTQALDTLTSVGTVMSDVLATPANTTNGEWSPLQVDTQGALYTTHGITGMVSGNNPDISDSTAEILRAVGNVACKRIDMMTPVANTGIIYVGGSNMSATNSIALNPGDFYSVDVNGTSDIYVLAEVDGEDIHFTYYT